MGKTETAKLFAAEGIPVFDADAVVHDLYAGRAAGMIEAAFPGTTKNGVVDRAALAAALMRDAGAMGRLEALIHPLVREKQNDFLAAHEHASIVLLDIPLLLETGTKVDAVVVVSAPPDEQRQRVLARPGMNDARFSALKARQLDDTQKRARADHVIMTDKGLDDARRQVKAVLAAVGGRICHA
jgi:dephospho-CoA kinase